MKATAIAAALLAAVVIVCQLPAQPGPEGRGDFGKAVEALPLDSKEFMNYAPRVAELAAEFGKAINAAVSDEVIKPQQADQMLKEFEADLMIRRVRLELLRAVALLDKAASTTPPSEELQRLRRQLKDATTVLQPQPRYQPADAPPPDANGQPVGSPDVDPSGLRATESPKTGEYIPPLARPKN